jgi:hypothetical protein
MSTNLSSLDRGIRAALALAAIIGAIAVGATTVLGIVLLVVGVILGGTAAVGFCPLYRVFGLSTCPVPQRR